MYVADWMWYDECQQSGTETYSPTKIMFFFWKPSKLDLTSFLLVKYVANFTGDFIKKRAIKFRRRESECWLPLECLSASDSAASLWLNTHWEFLAAEIPRSLCGFYFFLSRVNDWIISNRAKAVKKIQSLDINTSICCLISVEISEETLFTKCAARFEQ